MVLQHHSVHRYPGVIPLRAQISNEFTARPTPIQCTSVRGQLLSVSPGYTTNPHCTNYLHSYSIALFSDWLVCTGLQWRSLIGSIPPACLTLPLPKYTMPYASIVCSLRGVQWLTKTRQYGRGGAFIICRDPTGC